MLGNTEQLFQRFNMESLEQIMTLRIYADRRRQKGQRLLLSREITILCILDRREAERL